MIVAARTSPTQGARAARLGTSVERLEQGPLLDSRAAGEELEVRVADDRVGHLAEGRHDRVDEALAALGQAGVHPPGVVVDQVGQDRVRGSNGLAPEVGRFPDHLIGVLALRQPDDPDIGQPDPAVLLDLADQVVQLGHPEAAGRLAGGVDVIGQGDLLGIAGQDRYLARGEGRAEAGHDVVEAGLVGHQGIGVTLDDHRLARLADRRLRPIDEVQGPALVEQGRGRRVQVLRAVVGGVAGGDQVAPAEADGVPVRVADREDDPLAEPVVRAATRGTSLGQAHLGELGRRNPALGDELAGHGIPAGRGPAQLERRDRLVGEAPPMEVVQGRPAGDMGGQDTVVPGDGAVEDLAQARSAGVLPARALVQLDPGPLGQGLEGLREGDRVTLHHEAEDVTAQAAAEALPALATGRDIEGRGLLAVERAESLVRRTGLLQLDGLADDVDDRQPVLHFRGNPDGHGPSWIMTARPVADTRTGVSRLDTPPWI